MCVFCSQLTKLGLMASVWYGSCIWGRGRDTGAFQSPLWTKVFPSESHIEHSCSTGQIFRMGAAPLGLVSPGAGGAVWNTLGFTAAVLWGDIPRSELQSWDPELGCVCCRLQLGLDQAFYGRVHPIQSLTAAIVHSYGIPVSGPLLPVQFHLPLGSRFKTSGGAWTIFVENQALSISSTQTQTYPTESSQWAGKQCNNFREN